MDSSGRRASLAGRWTPILLYSIIVIGWFAEGAAHAAAAGRLWLVLWAVPAPALYLWRTRRRR